jgi:hypothetical protein
LISGSSAAAWSGMLGLIESTRFIGGFDKDSSAIGELKLSDLSDSIS